MRSKEKVIDSLINQLLQQDDYVLQNQNTGNKIQEKQETKLESVKSEVIESLKSVENNSKTEIIGRKDSGENLQLQKPAITIKNRGTNIFHETAHRKR